MWQSINGLIKGHQSVYKCSAKFRQCGALGLWWRVFVRLLLHTEDGCQRVSQLQYLGCHSQSTDIFTTSMELICNSRGMMLTSFEPNQQSPPSKFNAAQTKLSPVMNSKFPNHKLQQ